MESLNELPYSNKIALQDEARENLAKVIRGLEAALQTHDFHRGMTYYIRGLNACLDQKIAISANEREQICQLLWKTFQQPDLSLHIQTKVANVLARILKKSNKKADIALNFTVSWRPLYDILRQVHFRKWFVPEYNGPAIKMSHTRAIKNLIKHLRPRFDVKAGSELLHEFSGIMSSRDNTLFRAQIVLTLLYPTRHIGAQSTEQWPVLIERCLDWWALVENSLGWDYAFVALFARIAKHVPSVHWTQQHVQRIFARIIKMTDLALGNTQLQHVKQHVPNDCRMFLPHDIGYAAFSKIGKFLAYAVDHGDHVLDNTAQLMSQLRTYYQPVNQGNWTTKLSTLLLSVTQHFTSRLAADSHSVPASETSASMVALLLPLATSQLYSSQHGASRAAVQCLKYLSYLDAALVFQTLVDRFYFALETLNAAQQLVPTLDALSAMLESLILNRRHGASHVEADNNLVTHLADFLFHILPAIDTNDPQKTYSAFKFYYAFLLSVPLVQETSASSALSAIDQQRQNVTAVFPEWAALFLDKTFTYLSNKTKPPKKPSYQDQLFTLVFTNTCDLFFAQSSDEIYAASLTKLLDYIANEYALNATTEFSIMLAAAVRARPSEAYPRVMQRLLARVLDDDEPSLAHQSAEQLQWFTELIAGASSQAGTAILPFRTQLSRLLSLTLNDARKAVIEVGATLLTGVIKGVAHYWPCDFRSLPPTLWHSATPKVSLWCHRSENAEISWHVPSAEELKFAGELLISVARPAMTRLRTALDEEIALFGSHHKFTTWRDLHHVLTVVRSGSTVLAPERRDLDDDRAEWTASKGLTDLHEITWYHGYEHGVDAESPLREEMLALVDGLIQAQMSRAQSDTSPDVLVELLKLATTLLTHGPNTHKHLTRVRLRYSLWRATWSPKELNVKVPLPRHMRAMRANYRHVMRVPEVGPLRNTVARDCLASAVALAGTDWQVFSALSGKLTAAVKRPAALATVLPALLDILSSSTTTEDRVKMSVHVLKDSAVLKRVSHERKWRAELLQHLLGADVHTDALIQLQIFELFAKFAANLYHLPLTVDPALVEDHTVRESLVQRNNSALKQFVGLFQSFVTVLDKPNLHWRYELFIVASTVLLSQRFPDDFPVAILERLVTWLLDKCWHNLPAIRSLAVKAVSALLIAHQQRHHVAAAPWKPRLPSLYGKSMPVSSPLYTVLSTCVEQRLSSVKQVTALLTLFDQDHATQTSEEPQQQIASMMKSKLSWASNVLNMNLDFLTSGDSNSDQGSVFNKLLEVQREWIYFKAPLARDTSDHSHFSVLFASFWYNIARVFAANNNSAWFSQVLHPILETRLNTTEVSRASRCVTAELLSGMTRALTSDHVPRSDTQLITWWSAVHNRSLDVDDVDDWSAALRYSAHHRDPARFEFLIKSVLSPRPLDLESSSLEHVKQLNLIGALLPEHSWLALSYATDLLHYLAEHLTHMNKLVRLEIASLLNLIAGIYEQSAVHAPHVPTEGFKQFMRQLIERLDQPEPASDPDTKAMSEQARFKETIVSVIHKAVEHNNAAPLMPYLSRLLVALFAHAVDSNDDVKNSARKTLLLVAQTSVSPHYLDEYVAALEAISRSHNFQVRKTLLLFTQIMVFNHAYTLTQSQIHSLLRIITDLLSDPRVEVADTARVALSSFIKSTAPRINLADLIARFGAQLAAEGSAETRLGAALGLRGVIESYPYDVPDWMPAALTTLVSHLRDKNSTIRQSVNDGLQEFWRTHRDDWELNFKKLFTTAQINVIQQRTSTSYYA
eukprot:TRINITY_DN1752_c0_g1_i1.p1 TRINITY_DN1752_c0_g1~~TRINITY_DN1752_c0_g1_i1.p1  ORF type:complete len:1773 (+),score=520.65 TRINITY_DN1752_c0_g1_i1:42-5360(+)